MRILVVGAGAIGGYFGGRLLQANRDVTFLVRERRAAQLRETGLVIRSPMGDLHVPGPPVVLSSELQRPYDLILLSCKAYDLDAAIDSLAPAVGPGTAILPLLNGMKHLDTLEARFGAGTVLGGLCLISTTLDPQGRILHLNNMHGLRFGERDGKRSERIQAIAAQVEGTLRRTAQRPDPAGHVGEVGVHRGRGGHYMPDACSHWRHLRRRRRRLGCADIRRVRADSDGERLSAERTISAGEPQEPDHGRIAFNRVHAS